jgi:hypothetical protein
MDRYHARADLLHLRKTIRSAGEGLRLLLDVDQAEPAGPARHDGRSSVPDDGPGS